MCSGRCAPINSITRVTPPFTDKAGPTLATFIAFGTLSFPSI
jgi:hypothetical protein